MQDSKNEKFSEFARSRHQRTSAANKNPSPPSAAAAKHSRSNPTQHTNAQNSTLASIEIRSVLIDYFLTVLTRPNDPAHNQIPAPSVPISRTNQKTSKMRYAPQRRQPGARNRMSQRHRTSRFFSNFKAKKNRSIFRARQSGSRQVNAVLLCGEYPKKSERPVPVPGHALGVLYSGLHGTVWPTRQAQTTGISPQSAPMQIGRRHSCAKRPPRQRASRDKSGHLRNLPLKHVRISPANRRSKAFAN
jgi:hypothetical protein